MSDPQALLQRGRAAAERLMVDTCRIVRLGERGPMNPGTLKYDQPSATVYEGKCQVQVRTASFTAAESTAGERAIRVQTPEVKLPVTGSEGVAPGDIVEIIEAPNDTSLEGREFTVTGRHEKSFATARRLKVREGVSG